MTFAAPKMWRSAAIAAAVALLIAVLGAFIAAPRASAHDQLIKQTPGAAEQLKAAPTEVKLTFSATLLDLGNEIRVLDPQGNNVAEGAPVQNGPNLTQPLAQDLPDGLYEVRWRVVSSDGHPISDSYTFSIGDVAPTPSGQASLAAPTVAAQSAAPDAPSAQGAQGESASDQNAQNGAGDLTWLWIILGALGGAVIYGLVLVANRARKASKN